MNSRTVGIGAAVVAVLIVGAGYFFWQSEQIPGYTPPPPEPPGHGVVGNSKLDKDPYDVELVYTDNGFNPDIVTIPQGTRVRFLNESSSDFWPASGVHPTHTLYPEKEPTDCLGSAFDACQDLSKNEFYDFTFYYVGSWPCHDHLHAYNTCTINVIAATSTTAK